MARLRAVRNQADAYAAELEAMSPSFVECRAGQHRWEVIDDFRNVDAARETFRRSRGGQLAYIERVYRCDRCTAKRSDAFSLVTHAGRHELVKLGSTYVTPPGYAVKGVGNTAGMRGLAVGVLYDRAMNQPRPSRGRARRAG
jgi:hypothetical protein